MIKCDEIIEPTKSTSAKLTPANSNEKEVTCKTSMFIFSNFYILLIFLLLTIASLITRSIHFCFIKY